MFSKLRLLLVLLIGWTLTATAYGAVVHLNSGESLSGRIQGMDEQMLYLESDRDVDTGRTVSFVEIGAVRIRVVMDCDGLCDVEHRVKRRSSGVRVRTIQKNKRIAAACGI